MTWGGGKGGVGHPPRLREGEVAVHEEQGLAGRRGVDAPVAVGLHRRGVERGEELHWHAAALLDPQAAAREGILDDELPGVIGDDRHRRAEGGGIEGAGGGKDPVADRLGLEPAHRHPADEPVIGVAAVEFRAPHRGLPPGGGEENHPMEPL